MAAKAIVWLMILGALGGSAFYGVKMMNEDRGIPVGIAFGRADGTTIELHIVVPLSMPMIDSPPLNASFKPDWPQWIIDHYDVRDAAGNPVTFRRSINSTVIKEHEVRFLPDSYLSGQLTQGTTYTIELIPMLNEPEKYKYEFTAPSANETYSRKNFETAY